MHWYDWFPLVFLLTGWVSNAIVTTYIFYVVVYHRREMLLSIVMGAACFVSLPLLVLVNFVIPALDRAISRTVARIVRRAFREDE